MFAILGALCALWAIVWLVRRRTHTPAAEPYAFTRAEIAGYDTALPKYVLAAAGFLFAGGIHGLLVQLPAVRQWLALAGEPAQLVADEVSEQLVIVGGVIMLAMGLTCYALPRLIGRPLRNHNLARLSFVLTLAGTLLSALLTGTVGLLEGIYVRQGGTYAGAQAWLGPWPRLTLWLFEGARDAGYWTFALLVLLTVLSSRNVIWPRHRRRLTRWLTISGVALFVAVWQRVLHIIPESSVWLQSTGDAAILLGYQGYNHLHLYVGALVPMAAATFIYLLERKAERRTDWRAADRALAGLALAGSTFYLGRLGLSLYEGYAAVAWHLPAGEAAAAIEPWRTAILSLTGVALLVALVGYLALAVRLARAARGYLPRAIVGTLCVGLGLTFIGGIHGAALALLPPRGPSAGSLAHGTLSVGAGLLLPALTLADSLLIDAAGAGRTANLAHAGLGFLGAGIVLAYLGRLGLGGPAASLAAAGLQLAGLVAFALHAYEATHAYRSILPARLHILQPSDARRSRLALLELPLSQVLLIEFLAGLAGFPGLGWLFGGLALPGALLLYVGPCVAWALLPSLFALSGGWLHRAGWSLLLLVYLPASGLVSTLALRGAITRRAPAAPPTTTEEPVLGGDEAT
ncbi:MAG TPA: hypothetical protein PLJ35_09565 [Anaerolineae bacterium]|nr:hypothetical protein [Anaerolineae bacterium]HOQ99057.1 hypothetical protein [Anaerolineae bacterium]HPL27821.1 hypothetical protein [Anaerolineae bacterium]